MKSYKGRNNMKKTLFYLLLFAFYSSAISAQNFLPLVWKVSFTDTAQTDPTIKNIDSWEEANLLLSWERQGYFWRFGDCCLAVDFSIDNDYKDSLLVLNVGLQCYVRDIYINKIRIGGNIPSHFNLKRDEITAFKIPKGSLKTDCKNRIEIYATDLSYTGGRSHNYCGISPLNAIQDDHIQIIVSSKDHIFNTNASIKVRYKVTKNDTLKLCIRNDFHDIVVSKTFNVLPTDSLLLIDLKEEITKPGFYECVALLQNAGNIGDVQWFGLSPDKIKCEKDSVTGFKQYWQNTLAELKKIDPDFKMHKVDSLSTGTRDGFVIEMKSLGDLSIRGYYFVPRKEGKYPAILQVPGYGWGFQNVGQFLKNKDEVIELALCVRGHGISSDVFNPGFDVPGIWGYKLCNEEENAYRGIYCDCVRAVEFLLSRPETDQSRIGVMGGSQGGALTLATAGLCKNKIAACAYFDPFPCDIYDFINIREVCKPEIQAYLEYYNNPCSFQQALQVQELVDSRNFANWISCPVYFATGLFDDDCPPHVGFAAYNKIKSSKQYTVYPNDSHLGESDYNKEFVSFFKRQFKY